MQCAAPSSLRKTQARRLKNPLPTCLFCILVFLSVGHLLFSPLLPVAPSLLSMSIRTRACNDTVPLGLYAGCKHPNCVANDKSLFSNRTAARQHIQQCRLKESNGTLSDSLTSYADLMAVFNIVLCPHGCGDVFCVTSSGSIRKHKGCANKPPKSASAPPKPVAVPPKRPAGKAAAGNVPSRLLGADANLPVDPAGSDGGGGDDPNAPSQPADIIDEDDDVCYICCDDRTTMSSTVPCGHGTDACDACLVRCLDTDSKCPTCRNEVTSYLGTPVVPRAPPVDAAYAADLDEQEINRLLAEENALRVVEMDAGHEEKQREEKAYEFEAYHEEKEREEKSNASVDAVPAVNLHAAFPAQHDAVPLDDGAHDGIYNAPASAGPPAPVPDLGDPDAAADVLDEVYDMDALCAMNRLYTKLPGKRAQDAFIAFVSPIFSDYTLASEQGDKRGMNAAIYKIMAAPQLCLHKRKSGVGKKQNQKAHAQIQHVLRRMAEQESFSTNALSPDFCDLLNQQIAYGNRPGEAIVADPAVVEKFGPPEISPQARARASKCTRAEEQVGNGHLSRAAALLLQPDLVPLTPEGEQLLWDLHPSAPPGRETPKIPDAFGGVYVTIDPDHAGKVIGKLATGAASGCSGWTADILHQIFDDPCCQIGICALLEDISNDAIDDQGRQILLQSWLLGIPKPDAHPDVRRPLALGDTFFKVAALASMKPLMAEMGLEMGPIQFAIGISGGHELAFRTIQAALEAGGINVAVLFTDAKNAFNTANRDAMLASLFDKPQFATLYKLAMFAYGHGPSSLVIRRSDGSISRGNSEEGSRQGCPLGNFLYCNDKKKQFEEAAANLVDTTAVAYADDYTAVGPGLELALVADRLMKSGHNLNLNKTFLWWPHASPVPADVQAAFAKMAIEIKTTETHPGVKVLGGFLCLPQHEAAQKAYIQRVVNSHNDMFDMLDSDLISSQSIENILKVCVQPRLGFQARITPPQILSEAARDFDDRLMESFVRNCVRTPTERYEHENPDSSYTNSPLSPSVLEQINSPVRKGGVGLRRISDLMYSAYYASYAASVSMTAPFADKAANMDANQWNHHRPPNGLLPSVCTAAECHAFLIAAGAKSSPEAHVGAAGQANKFLPNEFENTATFFSLIEKFAALKLQRCLTHQLEDIHSEIFRATLAAIDLARLNHLSNKNASAWRGFLYRSFFTVRGLTNNEYCLANKHCLGLPPADGLTTCACGKALNQVTGDADYDPAHHQSCIKQRKSARNSAHDMVKFKVNALANKSGIPSQNEPATAGSNKRPDGCILFSGIGPVLTDTTIRHGNCITYVGNKSAGTAKVLDNAVRSKVLKYATDKLILQDDGTMKISVLSLAKKEGAAFMCLAASTYGDMHKDFCTLLRMITAEAVDNGVCEYAKRGQYYSAMVAEISTQIMKGNAWTATRHLRSARVETRKASLIKLTARIRKDVRNAAVAAVQAVV